MTNILQNGDLCLRLIAKEVPLKEMRDGKIAKLLSEMGAALKDSPDGVALAAPQIGISLRLFIVSPSAFGEKVKKNEHLVYINPRIVRKSSKRLEFDEGCLSVRNTYGKIKRHEKVTVSALTAEGRKFTRGGTGLLAEIFQHEIDHLDGILFIDKAKDLREILPENESQRN